MIASKLQLTNVHGLEKSENDKTITDKSQGLVFYLTSHKLLIYFKTNLIFFRSLWN